MQPIFDYLKALMEKAVLAQAVDFDDKFIWAISLMIAVIMLSFVITLLLSNSILGNYWRIFVAPGIILHELSHALLCMITGAKITKMSFFDKNGGHVEHTASKIPLLGQVMISIAPLAFGMVAIFFISKIIGVKTDPILFSSLSFESIKDALVKILSLFDYSSWYFWVLLYLVLSIAVTMTPSTQDLSNIFIFIILLVVFIFASIKFDVASVYGNFVPDSLFTLLSVIVLLLLLSLALSIFVFVVSKIFKR